MDFKKTALVLLDLQEGILDLPAIPGSIDRVLENANKMIELFRQKGAFIVFVRVKFHDGKDMLKPNASQPLPGGQPAKNFADFPPSFAVSDQDYIVNKRGFSAFFGTDLDL